MNTREGMTKWGESTGSIQELKEPLRWLDCIYNYADKLGCVINPSSRIAIFSRHLRRFENPSYRPREDPDFNPDILANGTRDLFELYFICEKLAEHHPDKLKSQFPFLLKGSAIPADDGTNQKVRNKQFELFFAARLLHSGFKVRFEEPDIIFEYDGTSYPVAAKQPVSEKKVVHRVREGIKQIEKEHRNGFLSISFDCVIPKPFSYLIAGGEKGLDDAARSLLDSTFQRFEKNIYRVVSKSAITGIFISLTLVGGVRYPWQVAQTSATLALPRDHGLPEEEAITMSILEALKSPYNH